MCTMNVFLSRSMWKYLIYLCFFSILGTVYYYYFRQSKIYKGKFIPKLSEPLSKPEKIYDEWSHYLDLNLLRDVEPSKQLLFDLQNELAEVTSELEYMKEQFETTLTDKEALQAIVKKSKSHHSEEEAAIGSRKEVKEEFYQSFYSEDLPASSIYCNGLERETRHCKIKNLYYHPEHDQFFIVKGNSSVFLNVPKDREEALVDLTSLSNHGVFFFHYTEVPEHRFRYEEVRVVSEPTFILERFHMGNIMHTIHDDFIGLYHHMKMYARSGVPDTLMNFSMDEFVPFEKNHHILFIEGADEGGYGHVFKMLTQYPLRFRQNLAGDSIVCFTDAIVGQSKQVNWYHYGFFEPQGPIPNKTVSGYQVREAAAFILRELHLPTWNRLVQKRALKYIKHKIEENARLPIAKELGLSSSIISTVSYPSPRAFGNIFNQPPNDLYISIFSRRHDRFLVNEDEMAHALESFFGLPVKFVRNEDLNFEQQVDILRKTMIAIGMHGSLLIMGMFLPPGAVLIELYPYAVPGDNYAPYKVMCQLTGMELTYRNWINTHPENNIPHPEYPTYHGGLMEFSEEKRNEILNTLTVPSHLCCSDPFWLFRIYQDTIASIPEVIHLIIEAIFESERKFTPSFHPIQDIIPVSIGNRVRIRVEPEPNKDGSNGGGGGGGTLPPLLHVEWDKPWNVASVIKYGVWIHQTFEEVQTEDTHITFHTLCQQFPQGPIDVWVRSYYHSSTDMGDTLAHTDWSQKVSCSCS